MAIELVQEIGRHTTVSGWVSITRKAFPRSSIPRISFPRKLRSRARLLDRDEARSRLATLRYVFDLVNGTS